MDSFKLLNSYFFTISPIENGFQLRVNTGGKEYIWPSTYVSLEAVGKEILRALTTASECRGEHDPSSEFWTSRDGLQSEADVCKLSRPENPSHRIWEHITAADCNQQVIGSNPIAGSWPPERIYRRFTLFERPIENRLLAKVLPLFR